MAMKLSTAMVERTLDRLEAQALPENHPAIPELNKVFGEHTFFIDGSGLSIVEPAMRPETGTEAGRVVKLASWQDAARTSLKPHEPEPTDVVVPLDDDDLDK
jgi:hypothetical protein